MAKELISTADLAKHINAEIALEGEDGDPEVHESDIVELREVDPGTGTNWQLASFRASGPASYPRRLERVVGRSLTRFRVKG